MTDIYMADCDIPMCECGKGRMILQTSRTQKNPGRKFYTCPIKEDHEKSFIWVDQYKGTEGFKHKSAQPYCLSEGSQHIQSEGIEHIRSEGSQQFRSDGIQQIRHEIVLHQSVLYPIYGIVIFIAIWLLILTWYVVYIATMKY